MNLRLRWALAALALALTTSAAAWSYFQERAAGADMAAQAQAFLASLNDEQRGKAAMAYDAKGRTDWHFIPKPTRKGLQVREMSPDQRKAAAALLRSALSEVGYGKAKQIMAMEELLGTLEKGKTGTPLRDTERYFFTVFDKPTTDGRWGLSVEGHHLSLNFVVDKGQVISSTPSAFAANPAIVMTDAVPSIKKGTRMLAKEETLAFDLLHALDADQRKAALISETAIKEVRAAGEAQPPTEAASGLVAEKLNDGQTKALKALVEAHAANMPAEVAQARLKGIEDAGWGKVHFAWAGADKSGVGHYYRIQGPSFLIEFVNTQPDSAGNPANHIHTVWRDMAGDFAIPLASKPAGQ